jgi:hypothetical protein
MINNCNKTAMKKSAIILVICSILLVPATTKASNCEFITFKEEKINLAVCSNYGRIGETGYLLFEARVKVLNNYIKDKIAKGELKDKKFEIAIQDPVYMQYLNITQGKNGYFVSMSGFPWPTLEKLITIVDYFAKPDWTPLIAYFHGDENETEEAQERRFNAYGRRIDNLFKSNINKKPIAYQPFTIWERDGVALEYAGDSLRYSVAGTIMPFKTNSTLPVKIQDRYIFFQQDSIFVLQD